MEIYKRFLKSALILIFSCALAYPVFSGVPPSPQKASKAKTDTSAFDNNLSVADTTVQKALETLDEVAGIGDTPETNQDDNWNNILTGTQTLITVTYDDGNNEVDFVVDDDLSLYDWTSVDGTDLKTGSVTQAYSAVLDTYASIDPAANVQSILGAADYAAIRGLLDLEAGTDFYSVSGADAAFQAIDATLTSIAALGTAADKIAYTTGVDTWAETALTAFAITILDDTDEATFKQTVNLEPGTDVQTQNATLQSIATASDVPGSIVDIANTTTETNIAANDLILIYDVTATANRAMTRGNFVTGIGAGQAVIFDIGDDGGNDSTDLGEIATTGDTNNIVTLDASDKMLIDMSVNWLQADTAVAASTQAITDNAIVTVDQVGAADNDFAKFTTAGLEGRSYSEVRTDLGIDTVANFESTLSLGAYASDILGAADSDALVTLLELAAGDIPDLSGTYEVQLNNEAGLYAVLSDVDDFVQTTEINSAANLESVANLGAFFSDYADDADASTMRSTLGLAIGSNVQAYDANLPAFPVDPDADKFLKWDDVAGALVWADSPATGVAGAFATWSGSSEAPQKGSAYTYLTNFDSDADGSFLDESWYTTWQGATYTIDVTSQIDFDLEDETITFAKNSSNIVEVTTDTGVSEINFGSMTLSVGGIDMVNSSNPQWYWYDADGGDTDKLLGAFYANMSTTTADNEIGDIAFTYLSDIDNPSVEHAWQFWDGSAHTLYLGVMDWSTPWTVGDEAGYEYLAFDFFNSDVVGVSSNSAEIDFGTLDLTTTGTIDGDLAADSVDDADLNTTDGIVFLIDGGGSAITTGVKGYIEIPFACTITQVTMLADQSTSSVVDIWVDSYANYPPTDADSITASAVPTITTDTDSQDATLTGWTTSVSAGDIIGYNVDSNDNAELLTVSLKVTR